MAPQSWPTFRSMSEKANMPKYAVKTKQPVEKKQEEQVEPAKAETDILEESKDWLDEIDELLEENAEEFVSAYVQKGGQ